MGWVATLAAVAVGVTGNAVNTIATVYWLNADISSYGATLVSNIYFLLCFWAMFVAHAIIYRDWSILAPASAPEERRLLVWPRRRDAEGKKFWSFTQAQLCAIVGFFFAWMLLSFNEASPPSRTPPLIQSVLLNMSVLVGIPLSKLLLKDRKRYCSWMPLLSGFLIMTGVIVSVLPTLLEDVKSQFAGGGKTLLWILLYSMGNIPWAFESVVEQFYLIRAGLLADDVTWKDTKIGILRMLAWAGVWQLLFTLSFAWVDFLPFVGFSTSAGEFWANTSAAVVCSFGGVSGVAAIGGDTSICSPLSPLYAVLAALGYVSAYAADAVLNKDSATFGMLNYVLIQCAVSAFFLVPGLNPNPTGTPLWSALVSVLLSVAGVTLWKVWEERHEDDQFGVEGIEGEGTFSKRDMCVPEHSSLALTKDISLHPLLPPAQQEELQLEKFAGAAAKSSTGTSSNSKKGGVLARLAAGGSADEESADADDVTKAPLLGSGFGAYRAPGGPGAGPASGTQPIPLPGVVELADEDSEPPSSSDAVIQAWSLGALGSSAPIAKLSSRGGLN